ncbi:MULTISPECIES: RecQ family ATP-dependent DNA helicase [Staphylococcus]|uniref:ATP-dependent DNA helicase RecQ n=1 Tax=Staphylococcus chromogenes TaxID=46126 RepID=A0AAE5W720_STACR|nr:MULTISPECIES: RecQ family ATP-dependent DNA helicase [Staphylococcus]MBP0045828.1 ATP-dependent DNA helicase RecQ [Staphylococcus chromogenes]MBV5190462.1 RecQ family ATP-dependent DNA helicase [Staphylococcus chromogenes]MBW3132756.1 RecQ family ATP-dependent DNA helicase [Staphylococcus chromogenes]MCE4969932.1 ATP-dependent DNA helicase RecQ [Staphylococcus chromogenes]MCE5004084.1 ATP-dependent DNA helicase RecQ [Staphylococcus chromogenes]
MLKKALKEKFGFDTFKKGQEEIITSILQGNHTLGVLPTGSGKSLCYQLPTYIFKKPTLVISPLISLMDDQVMQMKMHGEHQVVAIHSGMEDHEKRYAYAHLHTARFIFVSPEFILQPHHFKRFKNIPLGLIVLDEAHCLSEWGFDFRPHYALIGKITSFFKQAKILALTATATPQLHKDIELATNQTFKVFQTTVNRPNISLNVKFFDSYEEKVDWLLRFIDDSGPTIIYVSSKKVGLSLAEVIYEKGHLTGLYHGDLTYQERQTVQQQFLNDDIKIIVATSAFGMGINKPNIRSIVHFHAPYSPSNYIQEIGRAGRDGQKSQAILLYHPEDQFLMENLMLSHTIEVRDITLYEQSQLIDDVKIDILNTLSQRYSVKSLKQIFLKQTELKQRAYRYMMHFIMTKQCRREVILRYFVTASTQADHCCDNCNNIESISEKNSKKVKRRLNYVEKLENLLE